MPRNKVQPKKGNHVRDWQNATNFRSVSGMIAGLEKVAKHGTKKEKSIEEQSFALRKSLKRAQKQKTKLELQIRGIGQASKVTHDLRDLYLQDVFPEEKKKSQLELREKLNNIEKVISMKLFNLQRLARLDLANRTREETRQKTIKSMEKGIFPNDNSLIPTAIVRKIKKAGKPATLETVFTRHVPVSLAREIGKPFKKTFSDK